MVKLFKPKAVKAEIKTEVRVEEPIEVVAPTPKQLYYNDVLVLSVEDAEVNGHNVKKLVLDNGTTMVESVEQYNLCISER